MTPQPFRDSDHLTEEQFGELMAAPAQTDDKLSPTRAHLLSCEQCAAELESLRSSLSLFRDATTAYAHNQLCQLRPINTPVRRPLLLHPAWFAAAAALLLTAVLPFTPLHHTEAPQQTAATTVHAVPAARPAESDEALLEDVNRETTEAVPTPMQALADPIQFATSSTTSDQRKD